MSASRPPERRSRIPQRSRTNNRLNRYQKGGRRQPSPTLLVAGVMGVIVVVSFVIFIGRAVFISQEEPDPSQSQNTTSIPPTVSNTLESTSSPISQTIPIASPFPSDVLGPSATSPVASQNVGALMPDPSLQRYLLSLINDTRRMNGLTELAWDDEASIASLRHAEEMAQFGYLSHWNLDGYGPDYRYTRAGGRNAIQENGYFYRHSVGDGPTTHEAWRTLVEEAHQSLMSSPGHRDNILTPSHNRVGIGLAYNPGQGVVSIVEGFVAHYATVDPIPYQVALNHTLTISGQLHQESKNPVLNLAYEPIPSQRTVTELQATSSFSSPAVTYDAITITPDDDGRFAQTVSLNHEEQPGLYHLRLWVDTSFGRVLAINLIVVME